MVQIEQTINLELTESDIHIIIQHLSQGQYKLVNGIIFKLDKQYKEQTKPVETELTHS